MKRDQRTWIFQFDALLLSKHMQKQFPTVERTQTTEHSQRRICAHMDTMVNLQAMR